MRWQVRGAGAVDGEPRACIRRSVERKRVAFGSSGSLGAAAVVFVCRSGSWVGRHDRDLTSRKRKNTKKLMGDNLEKLLDVHFAMLKTEAGRRDVLECKAKTARCALEAAQSKLDEMNQFKIDS